jgi:hypothetical protein
LEIRGNAYWGDFIVRDTTEWLLDCAVNDGVKTLFNDENTIYNKRADNILS